MTDPLPFIPIRTRQPSAMHVNGSPDSAYGSQPDEAGAVGLTHDIRRANYHLRNLGSFVDALQEVSGNQGRETVWGVSTKLSLSKVKPASVPKPWPVYATVYEGSVLISSLGQR
jgi:hypothetical protein